MTNAIIMTSINPYSYAEAQMDMKTDYMATLHSNNFQTGFVNELRNMHIKNGMASRVSSTQTNFVEIDMNDYEAKEKRDREGGMTGRNELEENFMQLSEKLMDIISSADNEITNHDEFNLD